MLEIEIPNAEDFDELTEEFIQFEGVIICLEHSLKSISKWESIWKKPFLETKELSDEEILSYIKCMTITKNVKDNVYMHLSADNVAEIKAYIEDPMTATVFTDRSDNKTSKKEFITSELIYYWMAAQQIPFECENWNLNRLLVLIRICGIKNSPDKKMSKRELAKNNAALNAKRRAKMHSKG